ncbi:MAG TPA: universal stress protein [Candidatus Dormibacteraeota bacterium]
MIEDLAAASAGVTFAVNLLVERPHPTATIGIVDSQGHAAQEVDVVLERARSRLAALGAAVTVADFEGKPQPETIMTAAEETDADLIVLAPPHHSVIQRLHDQSLLHQLMRHSQIPVVLVPHPQMVVG